MNKTGTSGPDQSSAIRTRSYPIRVGLLPVLQKSFYIAYAPAFRHSHPMHMPFALVLILLLAAFSPGCSTARHASNVITRHEGFATIVMPVEEPFTGRRLIGPEEKLINGWLLRFETTYEVLAPRRYRVPAGTVVFTLKRGLRTIRGIAPFGFEARAAETYELRLDEIGAPRQVTIIELSTGRIASPLSTPKRHLKPGRNRQVAD